MSELMAEKKYRVWILLEEWEGDNKICDKETCLVGDTDNEDNAQIIFQMSQSVSVVAVENLPKSETE